MNSIRLYKNRHSGQRCVLVCNGPSLNCMDLSFLKHEIVIGLNKIHLGLLKFGFYPNYLVVVNEKVLRQSVDEIKNSTSVKFLSNRCPDLFDHTPLVHVVETQKFDQAFSRDLSEGLNEGWTVTYAALQVAYYLGFHEIYIVGMDHSYEFSGEPNQAKFMSGPDVNHFSSDYFGYGQEWDNPDLVRSEQSYEVAKQVFNLEERKIYDATVNGQCYVFEKVNYEDVFHGD